MGCSHSRRNRQHLESSRDDSDDGGLFGDTRLLLEETDFFIGASSFCSLSSDAVSMVDSTERIFRHLKVVGAGKDASALNPPALCDTRKLPSLPVGWLLYRVVDSWEREIGDGKWTTQRAETGKS